MPEQKHIDDLFREKMGSHTEAPPSFVWKNLEQKLDSTVTPGNVVSYYKWLRYGVILSALVVLVYFSGRKLMDTSDAKQTASEQVVAANAPQDQNDNSLNAGNAVADSKEVNALNEAANDQDQANGNSVATTSTTQELTTQNQSPVQANTSNTTVNTNSKLLAANTNNTATTTGRDANGGPDGVQAQPAVNNVQPQAKTSANNNTLVASNQNAADAHKTANNAQAPAKTANNTAIVAANQNTAAKHKTAQLVNKAQPQANTSTHDAQIVAANYNTRSSAHKTTKQANDVQSLALNSAHSLSGSKAAKQPKATISNSLHKSNIQPYAAKKEEYAQNSFKNESRKQNASAAKSNIYSNSTVASTGSPKADAVKSNTANAQKSNTVSSNHVANNTAGAQVDNTLPQAGNNTAIAIGENNAVAASANVNNNIAASATAQNNTSIQTGDNNEAPAAKSNNQGQGNLAATAANNTTQQTGNNVAAKNNLQPTGNNTAATGNSATVQASNNMAANTAKVNPAANTGTKATTKKVSTPEFIDNLVAKNTEHRKIHRTPMFETGFKLGYELGFQHFAANKYVIAPYVEYSVGKLGVMIQPAFKFARNSHTSNLGSQENYYSVTSQPFSAPPVKDVQAADTNHPFPMYIRTVTYSEKHDSIVINHHIDTKSYTEIDIPVLFKYNANQNFSFYAGVVFNYSNSAIRIKEDRQTYSKSGVYSYKDSFNVAGPEPAIPDPNNVFQYGGISYIKYSNADYQSANSMKLNIGYMLGFSYSIKDRYMLDVSMQQNLSNMNYVPNKDVRGIYTQPYFRISAGYKLFKSK